MKNKLMIFAVLTMCLCMAGIASAGDYSVGQPWGIAGNGLNPYLFTTDGNLTSVDEGTGANASLWGTWGGNADGAGIVTVSGGECTITGTLYELAFAHDNAFVDVGVTAGVDKIDLVINVVSYSATNAIIKIEQFPIGASFPNPDDGTGTVATDPWDPDSTITGPGTYTFTTAAVANAAAVAVTPVFGIVGGTMVIDGIWIGKSGAFLGWSGSSSTRATGGSPYGGFANPDLTTELTWVNPTTTPPLTEIYFVESAIPFDANETSPTSAKAALDAASVYDFCTNACESSAVTLTEGKYYAWRVVCDNIDPNSSDDWIFDTINTAPSAEAGYDQNAWLVGGTVTVVLNPKPNANDDVDDYPDPLTAVTSTTGGTFDTTAGEDPNTITFTAAGTYTITMLADDGDLTDSDSFDIAVYAEDTVGNYLVAHYPFDANAVDATFNGHDGTLNGDAAIDPNSQVGAGSLRLDGTDDYVYIADSAHPTDANVVTWADFIDTAITDPNNQVTISVWIKPATWTAAYTQIVTKGYPGGYRLTRGDYDGVTFVTDGMPWDGGTIWGSDMYSMGDGEWHHLAGTWDGGGGALYIDGNLQYYMPQPHGTLLNKNLSDPMRLVIGANDGADSSQHFNGLIDDVRIYRIGLSGPEVLKLYVSQGGSGTCGKVYSATDMDQNCVTNLADFAMFAFEWLDCRDPITCL